MTPEIVVLSMQDYSSTNHMSASSNISSSMRLSRSFSVFVQSLFNAFVYIGLTFTSVSGKSDIPALPIDLPSAWQFLDISLVSGLQESQPD